MYIWRGKNRRDRRDNKLQGLFSWGPDRYAKSEELDDDILRHEREEVHVDYFRHRVRVVMHEYLGTNNGKIEIQKVVAHLDELAHKEVDELEAAMEAAVTDTAILEDNEKEAAPNGDDPAQGSPNNNKESKESKKVEPKKRAIPAAIQNRNNVYEVFRKFDADGGGTLDIEEFGTLLSELEVPMTEKELEETFDLLDDDGGGEIDFEEFYEWFTSEAENQKKKNTAGYIANLVTGGMFDGFRRLVMEVEARNLAMDHAVYTAENDARQEFRIAHPPKYLCDKPMCTECFITKAQMKKHNEDLLGHETKDDERREQRERFHKMDIFLAGPEGRMVLANRLLYSTELASLETRVNAAQPDPYRPMLFDPKQKRMNQLLKGMFVQGYDPKMGVRAAPKRKGLMMQHLAPGRRPEQALLPDVVSSLSSCREDRIDIVSAPTTSAHAQVVFTWKGFAANKIEIVGTFNGFKPEILSPYLQLPAPEPITYTTVDEDLKSAQNSLEGGLSENGETHSQQSQSGSNHPIPSSVNALTFGRSSIIKNLGPGKYLYSYVIDGEVKLDEHASMTVDPITGKTMNIILVINPMVHHNSPGKKGFPPNMKDSDDKSVTSLSLASQKTPKKKGKYDGLVHLNTLHEPAYHEKRNRELESLKRVNLRNMALYDDGAWAFAAYMQRNNLIVELDVSHNAISDDGMQAIATILPLLEQLHTFKANGNGFGYDGTRYILPPLKASVSIRVIELSGNNICDDGAELIATELLPMHKHLKELYIDDNKIGNDGAEYIGDGLLHNRVLEVLSISKNLIYTYGINRLCFAVQSSGSLKSFRVRDNPLGAQGGRHVGDMLLMNDALTYCDASNIDLMRGRDGSGVTSFIAAVEKNKVLQHLYLQNNGILDDHAVDFLASLLSNTTISTLNLSGNFISAKWFELDRVIPTKLDRKTPSIATRMRDIHRIKADPNAKKYKGKEREMDAEDDGRWTWRRKWKKIDRKAELRKAKELLGEEEKMFIQLEREYCDEQLEKYLIGVEAFLDHPACRLFLQAIAKCISNYMKDVPHLNKKTKTIMMLEAAAEAEAQQALEAAQQAGRLGASPQKGNGLLGSGKAVKSDVLPSIVQISGGGTKGGGGDDDVSLAFSDDASINSKDHSVATAHTQHSQESFNSSQLSKATSQFSGSTAAVQKKKEARDAKKERIKDLIPWDDDKFNHAHKAMCKVVFLELGAHGRTLFLPVEKLEQAFRLLAIPITPEYLQIACLRTQVKNQRYVNFRKFVDYVKEVGKDYIREFSFRRFRMMADLYFHPPIAESKAVVLDHFKFKAYNDIRKNYRAQLEHKPRFSCPVCLERFAIQKQFDKHIAKGENSLEHRRLDTLREIHESQTALLLRAKHMVTNTYFPAFFELSPEKNLIEDYIPQVFDSMGEEGRPMGVVEPLRTVLVDDVLGDYLLISFEGRMGWVRYLLPEAKAKYRYVLRKACQDVPHFSWDGLDIKTKPTYYQVRDDIELPDNFELKVRFRPELDSEICGYLKKGQVVESRAKLGDWLQIRFRDQDAVWVVMKVGGGVHNPPLSRSELRKLHAEKEKQRLKEEEERKEKARALRAKQMKRRKPGRIMIRETKQEEVQIPVGQLGAENLKILHESVQKRLGLIVPYSPYDPTEEDLVVVEVKKYDSDDEEEEEWDGEA